MKPYLIFIKEGPKDGRITIKETELKRLIEKAYEDGYSDGFNSKDNHFWWQYPTITTTGTGITINPNKNTEPYKYEVTCCGEAANAVGD